MKNIFNNSKIGDKFKTRDNRLAILIGKSSQNGSMLFFVIDNDLEFNYDTINYNLMRDYCYTVGSNGRYWVRNIEDGRDIIEQA